MFTDARQVLVRCLSPMHAGVGQDIGSVDMPIQREISTGIPKVEASSFKGSLRATFWDYHTNKVEDSVNEIFGKANDEKAGTGMVGVTDLKLLFYPIKSDKGIYKLVTCPYLLNRFLDDEELIKTLNTENRNIPNLSIPKIDNLLDGQCLIYKSKDKKYCKNQEKNVVLDEYKFENIGKENMDEHFGIISKILNDNLKKDIVIINNEDFMNLEELNREIVTRNKIDQETGTVSDTALFTEEYLPAESILYGLFLFTPLYGEKDFNTIINTLERKNTFQIGGNTNLGKGIVKMTTII